MGRRQPGSDPGTTHASVTRASRRRAWSGGIAQTATRAMQPQVEAVGTGGEGMVRSNALWMWVALAVAACAGLASPAAAIVQGRDEPALARHAVMVLGDRGSFCTGVVLTAGHCVAGASAWRIYFKDAAGTGVMLEPRTVTVHPGYDANAVKSRRPSIDLAM